MYVEQIDSSLLLGGCRCVIRLSITQKRERRLNDSKIGERLDAGTLVFVSRVKTPVSLSLSLSLPDLSLRCRTPPEGGTEEGLSLMINDCTCRRPPPPKLSAQLTRCTSDALP
jgi:hypothetical protein